VQGQDLGLAVGTRRNRELQALPTTSLAGKFGIRRYEIAL
jgi:hypothetical protein